jgi:hypothetical protein
VNTARCSSPASGPLYRPLCRSSIWRHHPQASRQQRQQQRQECLQQEELLTRHRLLQLQTPATHCRPRAARSTAAGSWRRSRCSVPAQTAVSLRTASTTCQTASQMPAQTQTPDRARTQVHLHTEPRLSSCSHIGAAFYEQAGMEILPMIDNLSPYPAALEAAVADLLFSSTCALFAEQPGDLLFV